MTDDYARAIRIIQALDDDVPASTPLETEARWALLVQAFVTFFQVDPRFNSQRFITACMEDRS